MTDCGNIKTSKGGKGGRFCHTFNIIFTAQNFKIALEISVMYFYLKRYKY